LLARLPHLPLHACRIPSTTEQTDSGRSKEQEEEEGSAAALADLFNGGGADLSVGCDCCGRRRSCFKPGQPACLPACLLLL
jgi:hypothetical protein